MAISFYTYYNNGADWPRNKVQDLSDMIDTSRVITRRAFMTHVKLEELKDWEFKLGYESSVRKGLTMANDYHITYHRSTLYNKTVYYFRHSLIEYVFTLKRGN